MDAKAIYEGSDGEATRLLYRTLEAIGPVGALAMNLFRAEKCSERAKGYRRYSHTKEAYGRKQWSMGNLCEVLNQHATELGIVWGWGVDDGTPGFRWVLYVEVPPGQVSFHSSTRGVGPTFPRDWDGQRGKSHLRMLEWVQSVLDAHPDVTPIQDPCEIPIDDDTPFPFGIHKQLGRKCYEIPLEYWEWFLNQSWSKRWVSLRRYAQSVTSKTVVEATNLGVFIGEDYDPTESEAVAAIDPMKAPWEE